MSRKEIEKILDDAPNDRLRWERARPIIMKALREIVSLAPSDEPEPEDYDDTESAYNNGYEVAAWEAAILARTAIELATGKKG